MPAADLRPQLAEGVQVPLLAQLKKNWKVSMISILYRADDLGIVTPNQKKYLIQQFNQMQIRRREPIDLDVEWERPSLVRRWIEDYSKTHKLGIVEMAAVLCLQAGEFQEIYS
jgi:Zn-dependent peptidase ImmA (M78 family)